VLIISAASGKLRQEDPNLEASLGYIVNLRAIETVSKNKNRLGEKEDGGRGGYSLI
jgi:hypothetical protein